MAPAIPIIALSLAAIGTGVSVYSAIKQGQYAQASADYNSKIARQNAETARKQGIEAQMMADRQTRQKLGTLTAGYGASGVASDTGSALDILKSSASQAKLEAANVRYGYDMKGLGYGNQALLSSMEGDAASSSAKWNAAGALFSGGAKVASQAGEL